MGTARASFGITALVVYTGTALAASPEVPAGAASCSGCHASQGRVDTAVPPLFGRTASDIVAQMKAFKAGRRPSTVMDRIAKGFTDAEIQAIANWYALQK